MGNIESKVQEHSLKVGEWVDFNSPFFSSGPSVRLIYAGMQAGKAANTFSVAVHVSPTGDYSVAYSVNFPTTYRDITTAVSGYKLKDVKRITVLSVDELVLRLQVEKP